MTPHEEWVARTMLARGFEPFEVEDVLGLARYGPVRPRKNRPSGRANPVTPEEVERMAGLRAQGMTYLQIGTAMGRNRSTVGHWLQKTGKAKEEGQCAGT